MINDVDYQPDDPHFYCIACRTLGPDEQETLPITETHFISDNSIAGLMMAVIEAAKCVTPETMLLGFESRTHFIRSIIATNGGNTYEKHWRQHTKRKNKKKH
jgi:hypothetical protein